jgi:hypothetical protein
MAISMVASKFAQLLYAMQWFRFKSCKVQKKKFFRCREALE